MPEPFLRLAGIVEESCVDGPGLRLTIFTQGCPHHCPGCHNPETHPEEGGFSRNIDELLALYAENPLLSGITFSGGEPFTQAEALACLGRLIHARGGNVVCYTGYVFEDLIADPLANRPGIADLLEETDLLVDGPFILALKNGELLFRGSSNQRLLNREQRQTILRATPSRKVSRIRPRPMPPACFQNFIFEPNQ